MIDRIIQAFLTEHKGRQYYQEQLDKIDKEFYDLTVPKKWKPGLIYSSETKHLWEQHNKENPLHDYELLLCPKETGKLKGSDKDGFI